MAVLSDAERSAILHATIADFKRTEASTDIPLLTPDFVAAAQAIRDVLDGASFRTTISNAIDAAIAPASMTNAQKKRLFGRVIEQLYVTEVQ